MRLTPMVRQLKLLWYTTGTILQSTEASLTLATLAKKTVSRRREVMVHHMTSGEVYECYYNDALIDTLHLTV